MSSYKLTYFDGRGRGEYARLVFAAAGVPYEDERIKESVWPAGRENTPLGQLPYLTVDGVKIPHSMDIARFIAKRYNLAGGDDLTQAKADAVVSTVYDFVVSYGSKVWSVKEEERPQVKVNFLSKEGLVHLGKIEKLISLYGSNGHSVGSSLTWADLVIHEITFVAKTTIPTIIDAFPLIQGVIKSVEADPKVGAYLKARPESAF